MTDAAPADPFAVAMATVRSHDRDRYLADLFIREDKRRHMFALHAFNAEVARVREVVSEPQVGEIRLQWWRDALTGDDGGHPVARALKQTIAEFKLPFDAFERLLDARVFDLYDDPMPSLADLEGYAGETSSSLMQLAAIILAGGRDPGTAEAAGHAGVAYAITGLLRALPVHARRHQQYLPRDLMERHGADAAAMFEGRVNDGLIAVLADLRGKAREHLAKAQRALVAVSREARPAFLPLALVAPYLKLMEQPGHDPLNTVANLAAWRRPWILWRAARG
jgi:phytoene synthase